MKAMILAAGLGTRLKEITEHNPKCLIQAGGLTMIEHVLAALRKAGVTQVVINTHYLAEKVRDFFAAKNFDGIEIFFSHEEDLLGTGGGLLKVAKFFEDVDAFIVHNADVYSDIDLRKAIAFHREQQALATLLVMNRETKRSLIFSAEGRLIGWQNDRIVMPKGVNETEGSRALAFCGIQVLSNNIFPFLALEHTPFSTISSFLKASQQGALLQSYLVEDSYWIDIGTPEKIAELRCYLGG